MCRLIGTHPLTAAVQTCSNAGEIIRKTRIPLVVFKHSRHGIAYEQLCAHKRERVRLQAAALLARGTP